MATVQMEIYQLAGLDARARGFNRPVDFEPAGSGYRAVFRYETERILTDEKDTWEAALSALVRDLQARGYRQLRSQLSVRNGVYLGSQEPWVAYPDPTREPEERGHFSVFSWLRRWLNT